MHNPRHRSTSRVRRGVATAVAVAAVTGGVSAALAPSAFADLNDPHVIVTGGAGCHSFALASHISFSLADGETASANFSLNSYKVEFFNIPPTGTSGSATVTCPVIGGATYTYTRTVGINRPVNGNHLTINFPAG